MNTPAKLSKTFRSVETPMRTPGWSLASSPLRRGWFGQATAVILLSGLIVVAGCTSNAQQVEQETATPVRVETVGISSSALPISVVGTLESSTSARLGFKVGGPIARLTVDEGDSIRRGQLLGILATDEIDASVSQAAAALDKATRDAERMDRLYRDTVVTLAQYQDAQTVLDFARSTHKSAAFNREYAQIVAPSAGRILRRFAEPGELVAPGAPVFEIGFSTGRIVRASLTDRDVVRIRLGDTVSIQFDAMPGKTFAGRISRIGEVANPRTGGIDVEAEVLRPDNSLRSGFIARLAIVPSDAQSLLTVSPEALVKAEGARGTVYVLDEATGVVEERSVTIAGLSTDGLVIADGLAAGERVVTDGAPYLTDGANVNVIN